MTKSKINQAVDNSLSKGWLMSKKIREGYSGFFFYRDANYEYRTVYDRDTLRKLIVQGFDLEGNPGLLALNILLKL